MRGSILSTVIAGVALLGCEPPDLTSQQMAVEEQLDLVGPDFDAFGVVHVPIADPEVELPQFRSVRGRWLFRDFLDQAGESRVVTNGCQVWVGFQ